MTQEQSLQVLVNKALIRKQVLINEINEIDLAIQAFQKPVEEKEAKCNTEGKELNQTVSSSNVGLEE